MQPGQRDKGHSTGGSVLGKWGRECSGSPWSDPGCEAGTHGDLTRLFPVLPRAGLGRPRSRAAGEIWLVLALGAVTGAETCVLGHATCTPASFGSPQVTVAGSESPCVSFLPGAPLPTLLALCPQHGSHQGPLSLYLLGLGPGPPAPSDCPAALDPLSVACSPPEAPSLRCS